MRARNIPPRPELCRERLLGPDFGHYSPAMSQVFARAKHAFVVLVAVLPACGADDAGELKNEGSGAGAALPTGGGAGRSGTGGSPGTTGGTGGTGGSTGGTGATTSTGGMPGGAGKG